MSDTPDNTQAPAVNLQLDATRLLYHVDVNSDHQHDTYIGEVKVEPYGQPHMPLGHFTPASRLKGFTIELTPDPDPEGSIVAHVMALGEANNYELVLHVANYGTKTVTARVWKSNLASM